MAAIRFELGSNVLQFSKGIQYPVQKPVEKMQVMDRTAAGTLQSEDLGVKISTFPIKFKGLPQADYIGLMDWHDFICNGVEREFTYYNERGVPWIVKMLTPKIKFPETSYQRFSGELLLEVVT